MEVYDKKNSRMLMLYEVTAERLASAGAWYAH